MYMQHVAASPASCSLPMLRSTGPRCLRRILFGYLGPLGETCPIAFNCTLSCLEGTSAVQRGAARRALPVPFRSALYRARGLSTRDTPPLQHCRSLGAESFLLVALSAYTHHDRPYGTLSYRVSVSLYLTWTSVENPRPLRMVAARASADAAPICPRRP